VLQCVRSLAKDLSSLLNCLILYQSKGSSVSARRVSIWARKRRTSDLIIQTLHRAKATAPLSLPLSLSSLLANNKAPCTLDFISLFLTVSLQLIVAEAAVAVRPLTCSSDSCFSKILRRMVLMSWKQERRND
jgi:hypothetical protein